jgi:hypothetical protein
MEGHEKDCLGNPPVQQKDNIEDRWLSWCGAGSATMSAQRPLGWMTIMNSCILAEQLFDFIP